MIVCFLCYLLAVSVFFTTFVHKIYVVLKMEKVYAHREFGLEANIIGCATYEVKIDKFDSRDIGQLGTYVTAVNHLLRDEQKDNPTIGLLICKSKDSTLAKYALESSSQPLGISEYDLQKLYPAQLEGTMPTVEEFESNLKELVTTDGKTLVTSDGYQLSVSSDSEGNEDESPAAKERTTKDV